MSYYTDTQDFLAVMVAEFPNRDARDVKRIARKILAATCDLQRLEIIMCNRQLTDDEIVYRGKLRVMLCDLCNELKLRVNTHGDPRGYTVKLHLPSGKWNTMGGREDGYGVPYPEYSESALR